MSDSSLPLFLIVAFISSTVHSSLGFGFSIIAMIFFSDIFALYAQATAVSGLLSILTSFLGAVRMRRHTRWRVLVPCVAGYFLTAPIAIHLSGVWDKSSALRLLGGMLVLLGIYFIFLGGRIRIRPTLLNGLIAGALSGIGGGFFSIGGPPLAIYFLSSLNDKEQYSGTMLSCITLTALYSAAVRIISGVFTRDLLPAIGLGFLAVAAGAFIGGAILKRLPLAGLRIFIYIIMILSGIKMLAGV